MRYGYSQEAISYIVFKQKLHMVKRFLFLLFCVSIWIAGIRVALAQGTGTGTGGPKPKPTTGEGNTGKKGKGAKSKPHPRKDPPAQSLPPSPISQNQTISKVDLFKLGSEWLGSFSTQNARWIREERTVWFQIMNKGGQYSPDTPPFPKGWKYRITSFDGEMLRLQLENGESHSPTSFEANLRDEHLVGHYSMQDNNQGEWKADVQSTRCSPISREAWQYTHGENIRREGDSVTGDDPLRVPKVEYEFQIPLGCRYTSVLIEYASQEIRHTEIQINDDPIHSAALARSTRGTFITEKLTPNPGVLHTGRIKITILRIGDKERNVIPLIRKISLSP